MEYPIHILVLKILMKPFLIVLSLLLVITGHLSAAPDVRPYVNDKKAPENRKDLEVIQSALTHSLPKARAATVCLEMADGSGSGVIVSPEGLVLTAAHVTAGINRKITVILEDGTKLPARSLGLVSDKDAAMVQILDKGPFPYVEMDRNNTTLLGDWVFSLGHSGGYDKERGSVVRIGRLVRIANMTFQSDCTLIGGDSGGPLFDLNGKLIGIHSRVGQQLQVNMHVPMHVYLENWDALQKGEFLGDGDFAKRPEKGKGFLGMATEPRKEGGLRVTKVGKSGPAEDGGVKDGDVVLKFNGTKLDSREQMQDLLKEMSEGDKVLLEILRGGSPLTLTCYLSAR